MTAPFDASILLPGPPRPAGLVELAAGVPRLAAARVHQITGSARRTLALMLAARVEGRVVWIGPPAEAVGGRAREGLMPQGMLRWIPPERLVMAAARKADDRLWAAEQSLASRAAGLVVVELDAACGLTPVRRLLLAAEGGRAMGLILTHDGGAPGVESRWRMDFAHVPGQDGWSLELQRARMVPPGRWRLLPLRGGRVAARPWPAPVAAPAARPAVSPVVPPAPLAAPLPADSSPSPRTAPPASPRDSRAFPRVEPLDCVRHPSDPRRGPAREGTTRVGHPFRPG